MTTIKFLEHFPGHHIFISMKEDSSKAPIHYHDDYSNKLALQLATQNDKGDTGIFFTVNLLDESKDKGRHRTKKMVTHARAIFMDADDPQTAPLTDFPIVPSIIVETSPGKYHYYWLIDEMTDDLQTWNLVQRGLIVKYNGDDNAKDMTRYLRLPGYHHNKTDTPFPVKCLTDLDCVEKYSWGQLLEAFPPSTESKPIKEGNIAELSEVQSVDQLDQIISTGAHGLHQAINKRMLGMKRDGYSMKDAIFIMQSKGQAIPIDLVTDRITNRFSWDELVRSWNDPEEREIDLPDIVEEDHNIGDMPWPPGTMGLLAKAALDSANHPRKEIAIVTAIGVLSGICGRKFNVHGTGLNTYVLLVAKTGTGKDAIPTFIQKLFYSLDNNSKAITHLGSGRFTGPKSIIAQMFGARSQIHILSEAGLLMQSTAGDGKGITRTLLNMYGRSGAGQYTMPETYSKAEDSIPALGSPAMSITYESTPETLIDTIHNSGSLENGSLPRQSIFRIFGDKPLLNFDAHKAIIPDVVKTRINELIQDCNTAQTAEIYNVWDIEFGEHRDRLVALSNEYTTLHNDLSESDPLKSAMYGRCWVKMVKYAALVVAINEKNLCMTEEAIDWAVAMIDYEIAGLGLFFEGSSNSMMDELARGIVGQSIIKLIKRKYSKEVSQPNAKQSKAGIFFYGGLRAVCRKSSALGRLADDNVVKSRPVDGLLKVVNYMVQTGLLIEIKDVNESRLYKITKDFEIMMNE